MVQWTDGWTLSLGGQGAGMENPVSLIRVNNLSAHTAPFVIEPVWTPSSAPTE